VLVEEGDEKKERKTKKDHKEKKTNGSLFQRRHSQIVGLTNNRKKFAPIGL
jgi:hypothetical protein